MKVVINACCGGYGLSEAAYEKLGMAWDYSGAAFEEDRANPALVAVVEELGEKANGPYAELKVVEIPDGIKWEIFERDGDECVKVKYLTQGGLNE
jgi:hypothetical protein